MNERTQVNLGSAPRRVAMLQDRCPFLVVIEGPDAGKFTELHGETVIIGRSPATDFPLNDNEASRQHCRIEPQSNNYRLVDLQSTNGTFINGQKIYSATTLRNGSVIQVGSHLLRFEWRDRAELAQSRELDRELAEASHYVQSMLPPQITEGPVQTAWVFEPSSKLGGDVFGYHALDDRSFAGFMIDVAGHGAGAAMHSVSILNVLRRQALPGTDSKDPAAVLTHLNDMFQMDACDGQTFTMWYGVYDVPSRLLRYSSAGHHPGFLRPAGDGPSQPLATRNPVMGVMSGKDFKADQITVPPKATLYLFSDGVFEVTDRAGRAWKLDDFVTLLDGPRSPGRSEPDRLRADVIARVPASAIEDDFSIITVTFD